MLINRTVGRNTAGQRVQLEGLRWGDIMRAVECRRERLFMARGEPVKNPEGIREGRGF